MADTPCSCAGRDHGVVARYTLEELAKMGGGARLGGLPPEEKP